MRILALAAHLGLSLLLLASLPSGVSAGARTIILQPHLSLDEAGTALRRAVTAHEQATRASIPARWTAVNLRPGDQVRFGSGRFLLLMEDSPSGAARLLWIDDEGPRDAVLKSGDEANFGPLRVLLASAPRRGLAASLMIKSEAEAPLLAQEPSPDAPPLPSAVGIFGLENPDRIEIESADPRLVAFSVAFVTELNAGWPPEQAARRARETEPPGVGRIAPEGAASPGVPGFERGPYTDPTNIFDRYAEPPAGAVTAAAVTLTLVRAEEGVLRELRGSASYDSSGRNARSPSVGFGAGPGGGAVTIGSPGDRWRARLSALEASGSLQVESETFVRVPLGGDSFFSFYGPGGGADGLISARPVGRRQVELLIDQRSGDWSFLGAVSSRVRVADGGTVTLARHTSSRTSSSRSGPPLVGGIPFGGPMLGSSSESRSSSSFALFASVRLE